MLQLHFISTVSQVYVCGQMYASGQMDVSGQFYVI